MICPIKGGTLVRCETQAVMEGSTATCKVKARFLNNERQNLEERIKDLEKTLKLNKGIIADLLGPTAKDTKAVFQKMNEENAILKEQVHNLIKQQKEYNSKLLVEKQIVEATKKEIKEQEQEYKEEINRLLDGLNMKEFALQSLQCKFNKILPVLEKFSCHEIEVCLLLRQIGSSDGPTCMGRISNVVEENAHLKRIIEEANIRVHLLEIQLESLLKESDKKADQSHDKPLAVSAEYHLETKGSKESTGINKTLKDEVLAKKKVIPKTAKSDNVINYIEKVEKSNMKLRLKNKELCRVLKLHNVIGLEADKLIRYSGTECAERKLKLKEGKKVKDLTQLICDDIANTSLEKDQPGNACCAKNKDFFFGDVSSILQDLQVSPKKNS